MFRPKNYLERRLFSKNTPDFTAEFAQAQSESALIVLSTHLQSSEDIVRSTTEFRHGKSVAQILGYDSNVLPHLTLLKTALSGEVAPTVKQPSWLGGYALRPFPHLRAMEQHQNIIVAGIREKNDVREVYYGSHPDATAVDPETGEIAPLLDWEQSALGVLSSPLNPASRAKMRFWFSPYAIEGKEWAERLADDERLLSNLHFEGTQNYDGFIRHAFSVDRKGLARDVQPGDELELIRNIQASLSVVELCRAEIGKQRWHVYGAGNVLQAVAVKDARKNPHLSLEAVALSASTNTR